MQGIASMVRATDAAIRPLVEGMRALAETAEAVKVTEQALADLPPGALRRLTVTTVRCPAGKLLLRVVPIPTYLPAAGYDTHLVIPTSATTYQHGDQRITAFAWLLGEHDTTSGVRCRCHCEVTLSRKQLCGETPPPPGTRVLQSRVSSRPVGAPAPLGDRHRALPEGVPSHAHRTDPVPCRAQAQSQTSRPHPPPRPGSSRDRRGHPGLPR
jgi:hypothetical protein